MRKVKKEYTIEEEQSKLRIIVDRLHSMGGQTIAPRYPYVMVFTLPKTTIVGRIILPDQKNKPVYEGIVLKTFKPFYSYWKTRPIIPAENEPTDVWSEEERLIEPSCKVGDHVMFPHFAGVPIPFLNPGGLHSGLSSHGDFRLIRDDLSSGLGETIGILEYEKVSVRDKMVKLLKSSVKDARSYEDVVDEILNEFFVIDGTQLPRTRSGADNI